MAKPQGRLLRLKYADIDRSLLPEKARTIGSAAYTDAVSQLIRRLLRPLGGLIESLALTRDEVVVTWQPGDVGIDPAIVMLERGEYREAILVLELLLSDRPDDPALLYNLGMAYSDTGDLDRAVLLLRRLLTLAPDHVNGRIALGVALSRQKRYEEAALELERAAAEDPANSWAHRDLGVVLMHLARPDEAVEHLRRATELTPHDEGVWYGLGRALELAGDDHGADAAYERVLQLTESGEVAEGARQRRAHLAREAFIAAAGGRLRMDAVMYCLGALERFETMMPDEVQKIGFEIAILGMNGLDVNDPAAKYRLRSLPGEYSGLHLVAIQYVAFKQFAPDQDIGFDLSNEYRMALEVYEKRSGDG